MVGTLSPKSLSSLNSLKLARLLSWSLVFTSMVQGNQQHATGVSRWLGEGACLHISWFSVTDTCSAGIPYIKSLVVFWVAFYPLQRLIMLFCSLVPQFCRVVVTFVEFVSQSGHNWLPLDIHVLRMILWGVISSKLIRHDLFFFLPSADDITTSLSHCFLHVVLII